MKKIILGIFLYCAASFAQCTPIVNPFGIIDKITCSGTTVDYITTGTVDPSGPCTAGRGYTNTSNDRFFICNDGTWSAQPQFFRANGTPSAGVCTTNYLGAIFSRTDAGTTNAPFWVCTSVSGTPTWVPSYIATTGQLAGFTSLAYASPLDFNGAATQGFVVTLTGNVSSSTFTTPVNGNIYYFRICQDGTGSRTFAWPTGFTRAPTIASEANSCTNQIFMWSSAAYPMGPPVITDATGNYIDIPNSSSGRTRISPSATTGNIDSSLPLASGALSRIHVDDISQGVFCSDAGSTDTYACNLSTVSPAPSVYVTGTHYRFKANTANTGAATINFNSLGAKTIKKVAGGITTDLADNDIRVGQWVDLIYDGTNMQMQSTLGNAPSSGGSGGFTITTSGYCWIFMGCNGFRGTDASGALNGHSNNVTYMTQIVLGGSLKVAKMRYAGSGSGSMAFSFYEDSSNAPGAQIANTSGTTSSIASEITVSSPATLGPGTYWFGWAISDNTQAYHNVSGLHSAAMPGILGNATNPRLVSCSNSASGSPYNLPATCGTATGITTFNFSFPQFVFLPQ